MNLSRLAIVFATLSLLGFGGGNAIIPQMHADVVDRYHWITSAAFTQFYGLGKLAPGPTTTMAALVGYAVAGIAGAVVATCAVFLPAGVLVYTVGHWYHRLYDHPWRERFARAIAPVVLGLIWAGVVTLARGAADAPVTIALVVIATVVLLRTEWNQALLVLVAGVVGAFALR
ncbi:MAG TPA: chromate transporter [Candidatus Elarobacter sp.]|jgi:chromate transporter|nr:chromate transporter [Candidatus Elarobacter sp.]